MEFDINKRIDTLERKIDEIVSKEDFRIIGGSGSAVPVPSKGIVSTPPDPDIDLPIILLNGMTTGEGDGNREGTRIIMKSLRIQGFFKNGSSSYARCRVIVLLDTQCNKSSFSGAFTMELSTLLEDYNNPIESFPLWSTKDRFKILLDDIVVVNSDDKMQKFEKFIPLEIQVQYSTVASNLISGINTNALWLIFVSDQSSGYPTVDYSYRLVYSP